MVVDAVDPSPRLCSTLYVNISSKSLINTSTRWWSFYGTSSKSSQRLASAGFGFHRLVKESSSPSGKERNPDLRDFYLHNLSAFRSYHLVYVDESGCDKRIGFRRTGWSLLGVTPVKIARYQREQRYQILPAYSQDGVLLARVFQGSTDGAVFEDFMGRKGSIAVAAWRNVKKNFPFAI
jgi:hypothetical protein